MLYCKDFVSFRKVNKILVNCSLKTKYFQKQPFYRTKSDKM